MTPSRWSIDVDAAAEGLQHRVHACGGVGDGEVDLAGRLVPLVVGHQLRQRPVLLAERGEHVQRGQHAGVGAPEVAEVVVRRVLATEDRAGLGHQRLDVGVPDARAHGGAAALDDQFGHGARGDQVVDDGGADLAAEFPPGHQRGHRRRRNRLAEFVDDETAVGVAVEGQSDVGAGLAARGACRSTRFAGSSGLASWLGNVPSSSKNSGSSVIDGIGAQHRGRGVAAHAVARVDGHPQRPQRGDVDQRPQEVAVVGEHVAVGRSVPAAPSWAGTPAMTSSLMVVRPVSLPTGLAPARHSLMPL